MGSAGRVHIAERHFETPGTDAATAAASIVAFSSNSAGGVRPKRRVIKDVDKIPLQRFVESTQSWVPAHPPFTPRTPKRSRASAFLVTAEESVSAAYSCFDSIVESASSIPIPLKKRMKTSLEDAAKALDSAKGEVGHLEASLAEALAKGSRLQKLMDDFKAQRELNPTWRQTSPCLRFEKVSR